MKKMKRRITAIGLTLVMILSVIPQSLVFAEGTGYEKMAVIDFSELIEGEMIMERETDVLVPIGEGVRLEVKNVPEYDTCQWYINPENEGAEKEVLAEDTLILDYEPENLCEIVWEATNISESSETAEDAIMTIDGQPVDEVPIAEECVAIATFSISISSGLGGNQSWICQEEENEGETAEVAPGSDVTFVVDAYISQEANQEITYSWYREVETSSSEEVTEDEATLDENDKATEQLDRVELSSKTNTLLVSDVKVNQSYICVIADAYRNTVELSFDIVIVNDLSVKAISSTRQVLKKGQSATLSVEATANDLSEITYQWYLEAEESSGEEDTLIEGATEASYIVEGNGETTEIYRCEVADQYGNKDDVEFMIVPYSGIDVVKLCTPEIPYYGKDITLSVNATSQKGLDLSYQWQKKEVVDELTGVLEYRDLEGETQTSLTVNAGNEASTYRCVVTDSNGTVNNSDQTVFELEPESGLEASLENEIFRVIKGKTVTLQVKASVKAADTTLTYKWYRSQEVWDEESQEMIWTDDIEQMELLEEKKESSLVITSVQAAQCYYCIVSDAYGNSEQLKAEIQITKHGLNATAQSPSDILMGAGGTTLSVNVTTSDNCQVAVNWSNSKGTEFSGTKSGNVYSLKVTQGETYVCDISTVETSEEVEPETAYFEFHVVALGNAVVLEEGTKNKTVQIGAADIVFSITPSQTTPYRISTIGNIGLEEVLYDEDANKISNQSTEASDGLNIMREQTLTEGKTYYLVISLAEENMTSGSFQISFVNLLEISGCTHDQGYILNGKKDATCQTSGFTGNQVCKNCGNVIVSGTELPQLDHEYEQKVIKANATEGEDGGIFEICKMCGEEKNEEEFPDYEPEIFYCASYIEIEDDEFIYTGKQKKPEVTVYDSNDDTIDPSEYTVKYSNNINAGTATVRVDFKGSMHTGYMTEEFEIEKAENRISGVKSGYTLKYSTKAQKLKIGVKAKSGPSSLTFLSDQKSVKINSKGEVSIPKNFVGTVNITIIAKSDNYEREAVKTKITVNPAAVALKAVTPAKKKIKVTWAKNKTVSGFQIQYSLKKTFKGAKVKAAKNKATSLTISKLKSKTSYYVRIRSYKKVGKKPYYSAWSKAKKVTCK